MILDLDQEESLDSSRVGAKAYWLATARRAGLPILPGFVVSGEASRHHMAVGAQNLSVRGSGGARLAMLAEPISFADELDVAGRMLGPTLVARSSTTLEGSGEWSGAFTSYVDVTPSDLPKAVVGCWAAAFTVSALQRQGAAGVEPGSFTMPVLVQPALKPRAGGVAEARPDGSIVVIGVAGPPGPLLQGWTAGHQARLSPGGGTRNWEGSRLLELVGATTLDEIADSLLQAGDLGHLTRCEWAVDDKTWILQLSATASSAQNPSPMAGTGEADPVMVRLAQVAMGAPGELGEDMVMPWGFAGLPRSRAQVTEPPQQAFDAARRLCVELTAEVWGRPAEEALRLARQSLKDLRGPNPQPAMEMIRDLPEPDPEKAAKLLSLLDFVRTAALEHGVVARAGDAWHLTVDQIDSVVRGIPLTRRRRIGRGRWEPLVASVVLASGKRHTGIPAAPGIGVGLRTDINDAAGVASFNARDVIATQQPVPNLAPLLWDAAGLVTATGSPAAHLFESARSLGIPAVCGVSLPPASGQILGVDGHTGVVATLPLQ